MNESAQQTCLSPERQSIHERLRSATQSAHRCIESIIHLPRSVDEHKRTLARFYGFVAPWEERIQPLLASAHHQLGDRRKSPLLRNDLKNLGMSDDQIGHLPICQNLPKTRTFSQAIGSMYVLEGSTLGGQVLSKHVERDLGLRDGCGYSYYRSYGPRVKQMWQDFRNVLDQTPSSDAEIVIAAALDTFTSLTDWFSE